MIRSCPAKIFGSTLLTINENRKNKLTPEDNTSRAINLARLFNASLDDGEGSKFSSLCPMLRVNMRAKFSYMQNDLILEDEKMFAFNDHFTFHITESLKYFPSRCMCSIFFSDENPPLNVHRSPHYPF